jgi:hypothetical protein
MASNVDFSALERMVGKRLDGASRIVFKHDGSADVSRGALELVFSGDDVLLFQAAGDGEHLRVLSEAWRDPFAPPLSPENEAFVQQSGKHVRLDARTVAPALPVGEIFTRYGPIRNRFGTLAGVRLAFTGSAVRFLVEGDEEYVMTPEDPRFAEWGFTEDGAGSV